MRDDAAAGLVVVDHGRVDESGRKDPDLDDGFDDQLENPVRNGVDFAEREQLFVAGSALLQLVAVDVAFAEKVSEIILISVT